MSQSSMGDLILTHSQEMHLYTDQDVGSIMTLLDNHLPSQQQQQLYNNVYEETYQLIANPDQKNFDQQLLNQDDSNGQNQNGIMEYPVLPQLSPTVMPIPPEVISNEEYSGPLNFDVFIDPHHALKNPWVFSSDLNKLFITVNNAFPIDFKWDLEVKNLFVRATPLFSLAQHAQELVTRCIPHSLYNEDSNRNMPQAVWAHVIRCQSPRAEYRGDVEKKLHLNVLVPLGMPQPGMETVRLMYNFMCKNSCPSGMNRKPFEVVFTLEDEAANVYGRKKLKVRVCSCPKRDKEKEERDYQKNINGNPVPGKKRKDDNTSLDTKEYPGNKKRKTDNTPLDTKEYPVQLTISGKHNQRLVIKYAFELMTGELALHGPNAHMQKCMENLKEQLKNLDN